MRGKTHARKDILSCGIELVAEPVSPCKLPNQTWEYSPRHCQRLLWGSFTQFEKPFRVLWIFFHNFFSSWVKRQVSNVGEELILKSSSVRSLVPDLTRAASAKALVLHCIIPEICRHVQPWILSILPCYWRGNCFQLRRCPNKKENLVVTRQNYTTM